MGKIGDLWVKLSLKKEEFERGMNSAKKGVSNFGSNFSKVGKLAGGVFGVIAGAAVSMASQLIANTNKFGDAWARTMGGAKNSWQSFLSAITSGNTKNLWGRIKGAFNAGKEEAAARDQLFETGKASELARAQIQGQLNDLYLDIYNTSLPPEVRQAAIRKYQSLLAPIYEAEKQTTKAVMDATIKSWLAAGGVEGVSQDQVIDFFKKLGISPDEAKANPLYKVYDSMGDNKNGAVFDAVTAYVKSVNGLQDEMRSLNKKGNLIESTIGDTETVNIMAEALPKIAQDLQTIAQIETPEVPELISQDYLDAMEARGQAMIRQMQAIGDAADMLNRALEQGVLNGLDELANVIAGVEGSNLGSVAKAVLSPIADAAVSAGLLIMTAGKGIQAFTNSFQTLNGAPAIIAGAALMAVGVAAKAGLAAIGKGNSSSAGTSSVSSSAGTYGAGTTAQELTIYVKGTISGSDIALSYDRQKAKWNR